MDTSTVQFSLVLFIAACVLLIVWGWVRVRNAEVREHEELQSNNEVRWEIAQIELYRPNHIIDHKEEP